MKMTTGDLRNNLKSLQAEIKLLKYPETVDLASLSKGVPAAFLPIYHYAFTSYDAAFTEELSNMNIELYGKSDLRFMEGIYKILRDVFSFKPSISKAQFFSPASFVEQKVIMCTKVLQLVRARSNVHHTSKNSKFRVSSSMDNIAKLATAKNPSRSTRTGESKDSSSLGNRQIQKSRSGQFLSRANLRSSEGRHSLMLPPEPPTLIKDHLNLSEIPLSSHKQAWAYTPSIKKVNSSAVVVVNIPKDEQAESTLNDDSQLEMLDIIASTPCASILEPPQKEDNAEIAELKAQMEAQQAQMLKSFRELTNRVELLEEKTEQQLCCQSCNGLRQQLILLQNEVKLMKANNVSVPQVSMNKSPTRGPATEANDSLSGSIISVEGVVNGESKVQRMARAAEAKIRSLSDTDSIGTIFSPIKAFDRSNGHLLSSASPDCVLQTEASLDPRRSSTPTGVLRIGHDSDVTNDIPIDESTIEKINRIKQMFSETDAMLPKSDTLS